MECSGSWLLHFQLSHLPSLRKLVQMHNGDTESWLEYWYGSNVENPIDYAWVESHPMRRTSRPIALEALPKLRGAMP